MITTGFFPALLLLYYKDMCFPTFFFEIEKKYDIINLLIYTLFLQAWKKGRDGMILHDISKNVFTSKLYDGDPAP